MRVAQSCANETGTDLSPRAGRARELAATAVKLDQKNEFCHWQLGCVWAWFGETDQAIAAFRRALEINPNYALAWGTLGSVLAIAGHAEESISASEVGIHSNPRDPSNFLRFTSLAGVLHVGKLRRRVGMGEGVC